MSAAVHTPGPWRVCDFRASEMRRLGWTGPAIDRILIVNKSAPEIVESEGQDCVIARIQFDNRTEELREGNLADATLIAAAPELFAQLEFAVRLLGGFPTLSGTAQVEAMRAALAKARGETA